MIAGNIDVDVVSGHLWVTGRPDDRSFVKHAMQPHRVRSPSKEQWTRHDGISTSNLII